jgi:hypothetical protein
MAYGSSSGKCCASCGGQLGSALNCPACGTLYPDFFVAADPALLKRKARALKQEKLLGVFKGIEFTLPDFKSGRSGKSGKPHFNVSTVSKSSAFRMSGSSQHITKLIVGAVAIILILAGGYLFYAQKKAEKQYVNSYFKALYAIKTGADYSRKVSTRISSDWKAAQDSGRSFSQFPSTEELNGLSKIKTKVDSMVNNDLANPPKKIIASRDAMLKLNEQYSTLNSLASAPPNSYTEFNTAVGKASASFDEAAKTLRSSLSGAMISELAATKKKYKNLNEF